MDLVMDF